MKNAWKWILGILIVLVIVAAVVAVPFVMRNYMVARFSTNATANAAPQPGAGNSPGTMPGFGNPQNPKGYQPGRGFGFDGRRGPMMGGGGFGNNRGFGMRGFGPFGFGLMLLGGFLHLLPWVLLGLLLWGAYALGRRSGLHASQPPAPAPLPASPAQPAVVEPQSSDSPSI